MRGDPGRPWVPATGWGAPWVTEHFPTWHPWFWGRGAGSGARLLDFPGLKPSGSRAIRLEKPGGAWTSTMCAWPWSPGLLLPREPAPDRGAPPPSSLPPLCQGRSELPAQPGCPRVGAASFDPLHPRPRDVPAGLAALAKKPALIPQILPLPLAAASRPPGSG